MTIPSHGEPLRIRPSHSTPIRTSSAPVEQMVVGGHRFACRTAESLAYERLDRMPVSEGVGAR